MNSKNILFLCAISMLCLFVSCSDSVSTKTNKQPLVSLAVGDERQFIYTVDSSTIFFVITGQKQRSDGLNTFVCEEYYGKNTTPFVSYYAIKDGYYISTRLDTTYDPRIHMPNNPYCEQRLAKLFPNDGDTWQNWETDSTYSSFTTKSIGSQKTPAGVFNNCFGFTWSNRLNVNYAEGIGHISSTFLEDGTAYVSTYIKVNGKVYGNKFPAKNFPQIDSLAKSNPKKMFKSLLGIF